MPRLILPVLVASVCVLAGCGDPEGPALEVFVQIVKADQDLDTSDIVNFLVRVGDDEEAVNFDENAAIALALETPPAAATAFVVFACTNSGAFCAQGLASFVGCTVEDLAPSDDGIAVTVAIDEIDPLPAACVGIVTP
jgi:hypothetical protein